MQQTFIITRAKYLMQSSVNTIVYAIIYITYIIHILYIYIHLYSPWWQHSTNYTTHKNIHTDS